MNREQIYYLKDGEGSTFEYDNSLPPLPLPKLEDTLKRYYETLKPFGTQEELKNSQKIIQEFLNGIGSKLHKKLEERAATEKNWVEKWWEDYAYHTLRIPLHPYTVMAMPCLLEKVNVPETPEYCLKMTARVFHHTLEFWDLIRRERMRPGSSSDGKVKFSSTLFRRFVATARIPGEEQDSIESHFRTLLEGGGPVHAIVIGKGRIFKMDCLNNDGSIFSPQQILICLERIRNTLDYGDIGDCVPVLTCDDRTSWAKNRKHLQEISPNNKNLVKLLESSLIMTTLDEHEPTNYSESAQMALSGDFHSKWADRSSIFTVYRNGKLCCIGEHSAYDGTISISFSFFLLLSLFEIPEPDWNETPKCVSVPTELFFELDDQLRNEIKRVMAECDERRYDIVVLHNEFKGYGKAFTKVHKLHPDAYIQMILQLTYYKLHNEFAPTYETALMRDYYNGRTETLRACTTQCADFVLKAVNPKSSQKEIFNAFKVAIDKHNQLMADARKGKGVDRHLFGLWCVAYENNIDIPELYSDPLYAKSGGGGNFILSTSSLGYTVNTGFVAPMVIDGYGVFYSITDNEIYVMVTAYRSSFKTSTSKFMNTFQETMMEMKDLIEKQTASKL